MKADFSVGHGKYRQKAPLKRRERHLTIPTGDNILPPQCEAAWWRACGGVKSGRARDGQEASEEKKEGQAEEPPSYLLPGIQQWWRRKGLSHSLLKAGKSPPAASWEG